jgi:hypothetical protein
MKKIIIGLCFISILFASSNSVAQELLKTDPFYLELETKILTPFFNALKDGNVDIIKQYISTDMYRKNRRLLDQNRDYPEFLRKFYKGASFHAKSMLLEGDKITVDVEIQRPNKSSLVEALHLIRTQHAADGEVSVRRQWKIKDLKENRAQRTTERNLSKE